MTPVQNRDFMRAILHHKLDAINSISHDCGTVEITWYLRQDNKKILIGREINKKDYAGRNYDNKTEATEDFKTRYIDTTPPDVWRCKSCAKRGNCDIIREDLNQSCLSWEQMPR